MERLREVDGAIFSGGKKLIGCGDGVGGAGFGWFFEALTSFCYFLRVRFIFVCFLDFS